MSSGIRPPHSFSRSSRSGPLMSSHCREGGGRAICHVGARCALLAADVTTHAAHIIMPARVCKLGCPDMQHRRTGTSSNSPKPARRAAGAACTVGYTGAARPGP